MSHAWVTHLVIWRTGRSEAGPLPRGVVGVSAGMCQPDKKFCQSFLEGEMDLCAFHFLFLLSAAVKLPEGPGVREGGSGGQFIFFWVLVVGGTHGGGRCETLIKCDRVPERLHVYIHNSARFRQGWGVSQPPIAPQSQG